jgi:hypothetical protein
MDYKILMFRVITVTRNRIEVIGNSQTGRLVWLNIEDVIFKYWPQFIVEVNSIEVINTENNPVRIKALENSAILSTMANIPLRPLAIKNEWLLVSTNGLADRIPPTGWIRWRREGELLITYSLLE